MKQGLVRHDLGSSGVLPLPVDRLLLTSDLGGLGALHCGTSHVLKNANGRGSESAFMIGVRQADRTGTESIPQPAVVGGLAGKGQGWADSGCIVEKQPADLGETWA